MTTSSTLPQKMRKMVDALNLSVLGLPDQMETAILTLFADGHVTALGEPGTGKTRMAVTIAASITDGEYAREQMVPDTMPSDLVGTEVKKSVGDEFVFIPANLTANLNIHHIDEINRALPRTQSALLQAMEERRVNVPGFTKTRIKLNDVYFLVATQNPLDLEGTYPLPAAQMDRFAVQLNFPALEEAQQLLVLKKTSRANRHALDEGSKGVITLDEIREVRKALGTVEISDEAYGYANRLVLATRPEHAYCPALLKDVFKPHKSVSPRGGQWLIRLAEARAFMYGRPYVSADDIKAVAIPVLRHRVSITEEKEMEGWTADKAIEEILEKVSPAAS